MTQEESYEKARKAYNKEFLQKYYKSQQSDDHSTTISRRYASDMLTVINTDDEELKKEINNFWNDIQTQRYVNENKIEFLHETIEYLRELVIDMGNDEVSLAAKADHVRSVKNKDFIANIRQRIKSRIAEQYRKEQEELQRKEEAYAKKLKEAQRLMR